MLMQIMFIRNSSTLITVLKEVGGHENIAGAALNSIVQPLNLQQVLISLS